MQKDQPDGQPKDSAEIFEETLKESGKRKYLLRLYIAGTSTKSTRAIDSIRKICEEHLKDHYQLEVIDIYQQPTLAEGEQIVAVPTLVKRLPPPLRKFIGNLTDVEKILVGLDLKPKQEK